MTKIKICGLKRLEDIEIVNNFCPDYIGFVFAKSKRQISLEEARRLKKHLKASIKVVGVFVNEPLNRLLTYEDVIDYYQLHGDESLKEIATLKQNTKLPIIKALRLKDEKSLEANKAFLDSALVDYLLLDTYSEKEYGGSGKSFNWELLKSIKRPFFLAGGIGSHNLKEALEQFPYAIDVSSSVETNGNKDAEKIKTLMALFN